MNNLLDRIITKWLIFTFIVIIILSLPFFFARGIGVMDDTNFLIIAKWIKYGFKPYNDLAELKPPAIYYTLYILDKFFGEAWWVSRVFILLVDVLFALLFVFFLNKRCGDIIAWFSGINLYLALMLFGGYRIHTETFCALLGMIGLFFIINKKDYTKHNLLFGIIIGFASLYKQPAVFYLIAYILFLLILREDIKKTIINIFFVLLGFSFVWLVTILLLYKYSMLKNFIKYVIILPFMYPSDPKHIYGLKLLFLRTPLPLIVLFLIFLILKKRKINYDFSKFELLLFLVIIFSYIPILKRPSPHYYICLLFALIILCVKLWVNLIYPYLDKYRFKSYLLFKYILLIIPSLHLIGGLIYGSIFFIRENRLKYDCLLVNSLGRIVNTYTSENEPILCFSHCYTGSRFYYILERRPLYPYSCMTSMPQETKKKLEELIEVIKYGKVSLVIMEDLIEENGFTVIPKEQFIKALSEKYKKVDFPFDKDYSRNRKIDIYILKDLKPRDVSFKSKIFPKPCNNY